MSSAECGIDGILDIKYVFEAISNNSFSIQFHHYTLKQLK